MHETEEESTICSESEIEPEDRKSSTNTSRHKNKTKAYLQDFKILAYIKQRMNDGRKIKL